VSASDGFGFVFDLEGRRPLRAVPRQKPDHRPKIDMDLYQGIAPLVQSGPRLQFTVIAANATGSSDQTPGWPLAPCTDAGSEQFGTLDEFRGAEISSAHGTEPARRPEAGFNAFRAIGFSMRVSAKGHAEGCGVCGTFDCFQGGDSPYQDRYGLFCHNLAAAIALEHHSKASEKFLV
jgi:hypothetical protein